MAKPQKLKRKTLATVRKEAMQKAGIVLQPRHTRAVAVAWRIRPEMKALISELSIVMTTELRQRIGLADVFEEALEFFARENYPELAERHLAEGAKHRANAP